MTWLDEHKKAWSAYDLFSLIRIMRAGSPRKVGEDGARGSVAIQLDQMARCTTILAMELAYKCLKSFTIQSTHPDAARVRDICYTLLGTKHHRAEPDETGEWMLARSSSVPVGEQKQEEGV